jgi:hypothetical protein
MSNPVRSPERAVASAATDRWKIWWAGADRPFLILTPTQYEDAELLAEIENKYPGVEVRQSEYLPEN